MDLSVDQEVAANEPRLMYSSAAENPGLLHEGPRCLAKVQTSA